MLGVVTGWAIAGAWVGRSGNANNTWQIVMEDFSSVQCYLWDITLLNAQRRDTSFLCERLDAWHASNQHCQHLLATMPNAQRLPASDIADNDDVVLDVEPSEVPLRLPVHSRYDALADTLSVAASSPLSQCIYGAGVALWAGLGKSQNFDNTWQLYVNTATAVELTLMTTFLQNTKRRHRHTLQAWAHAIDTADHAPRLRSTKIVLRLPPQSVRHAATGYWTRVCAAGRAAVDGYAHFMGSAGGVTISGAALGTWLGLGQVMGYGNSNWWLVLGTFTGLVGFIDGFVLRNVQRRQTQSVASRCDTLEHSDAELLRLLQVPAPRPTLFAPTHVFDRLSMKVGRITAHPACLGLAIGTVGGLLATATAMHWSQTAQLICNTPTMIVEGALLLVLMHAHMSGHHHLHARLKDAHQRRTMLVEAINLRQES